ncbi:MAG: hypothetical protein LBM60_04370 [Clostridium sp.]|jgi:hypothetical protein|nr:hypothetical protein [Clostridium sp.]
MMVAALAEIPQTPTTLVRAANRPDALNRIVRITVQTEALARSTPIPAILTAAAINAKTPNQKHRMTRKDFLQAKGCSCVEQPLSLNGLGVT